VGDSTIRGAAQAAARVIEQQAQAVTPPRLKEAAQAAAQVAEAGAQPIKDSVKEIPKQAKAIAKICLDNPALAPLIVPGIPFVMAAKGAVAIHQSHVAVAKALAAGAKEVAHDAQALSPKQKFMIATNPALMFLPPGIREMAIAGEIKRAAEAAKKAPNND
jgi:hypothetical protein